MSQTVARLVAESLEAHDVDQVYMYSRLRIRC